MENRIQKLTNALENARQSVARLKERIANKTAEVENQKEAATVVQNVSQNVQAVTHKTVADLVSRCLDAIFGEGIYSFQFVFQKKRDRTEAVPVLTKNGKEQGLIPGTGGGVLDIISLALRLAKILLSHPKKRRILILDEPFRHLSKTYSGHQAVQRAGLLLEKLSEEYGFQIIMVTHIQNLDVGTVVQFS